MPCRCDSNPCSSCVCAKAKIHCTDKCHGQIEWSNVPCLNTEIGKKVKTMSIKDVRSALCENGLSPVGDKSELVKRLAVFYDGKKREEMLPTESGTKKAPLMSKKSSNKVLFESIMESEGNHEFVLSLSGKEISKLSSKPELRKAYILLSTKVHPDKNQNSKEAVQAFQVVLNAFEQLANPEKFEEDENMPAKKRQKTEHFTRSNLNCFKSKVQCPQCRTTWGQAVLGLEDAAYNFFMQAIKQYICGLCSCEFGCMTAIHFCPHCNKPFEYDPDDYHRQIMCGNDRCKKPFGFMMFKVSARREKEVRNEAKVKQEEYRKRILQKNRRAARAGSRLPKGDSGIDNQQLQEKLFLIGLRDSCPNCGWEVSREDRSEDFQEHLNGCNDKEVIERYKKKQKTEKIKLLNKQNKKEIEAEVMAVKQWEHNGRQVGQLWMLSDVMLKKLCKEFKISDNGARYDIITRLSSHIRSNQRLMITDGKTHEASEINFDKTSLAKVDEEDLPTNINQMEREELQDLCASYGVKFDGKKDVKSMLLRKFLNARSAGQAKLMICDRPEPVDEESSAESSDDDSEAYVVEE